MVVTNLVHALSLACLIPLLLLLVPSTGKIARCVMSQLQTVD
jgi:hypothetical protein